MNRYGTLFNISIYGESHSGYMGVIIDGIPPGKKIDIDEIKKDLKKRRPEKEFETKRIESDDILIKSGIFNGYTTGAPVCIEIENHNFNSPDYENISDHPRPGHADLVARIKYDNFQDYRGGGMFSGRLTALIVIAGSIAKSIIPFSVSSRIISVKGDDNPDNFSNILKDAKEKKDSVGGVIELKATNMIVGLGNPFFDKLSGEISKLLFSVPSVKGVEFGLGFKGTNLFGSEYNDIILNESHKTKTNNQGGISGGISNGNDLIINCAIRPISSVGKIQNTYNLKLKKREDLQIEGRHDSSVIERIGIVLESALAIVLADQYLLYGKK